MEVMALYWGLTLVISMGWRNVEIKGDSKTIIENVKGNMSEGWAIKNVIEDIKNLLVILNRFDLNHLFWEENSVVNGMVVLGLNAKGLRCWREFNALPNLVRDLVNQEIKYDES